MEIRGLGPNRISELVSSPVVAGFPCPVSMTVCPYPSSDSDRIPDGLPRLALSGGRGNAVSLLPGLQRPGDACHPVGQRYRDDLLRLPRQHPRQPGICRHAAPEHGVHHRHGTRDHEPPEITLAHLRYFAKPRLTAGCVLSRHKAEPGGKVPPTPEALHRRGKSPERHRRNRPHPMKRSRGASLRAAVLKPIMARDVDALAERFPRMSSRDDDFGADLTLAGMLQLRKPSGDFLGSVCVFLCILI